MDDKFKINQSTSGNLKQVNFKGAIDEDANFDSLMKLSGEVVFNFKEVISINSCGVRNWVNFLKEFSNGRAVYFDQCPPLIVRQMNMIPSFVGEAHVKSLYASYICDNCDKEKLVLIKEDIIQGHGEGLVEVMTCEFCQKGEMEFDGHPRQYFAFVK